MAKVRTIAVRRVELLIPGKLPKIQEREVIEMFDDFLIAFSLRVDQALREKKGVKSVTLTGRGKGAYEMNEQIVASPRELQLEAALRRCLVLVPLVTIRQVMHASPAAIEAAGLDPWCVNEGRAGGDENVSAWWIRAALDDDSKDGR